MPPPKVSNLRLELLKHQDDSTERLTGIMTVTSLSESLRRSYPSNSGRGKPDSEVKALGDSSSSHVVSKSVSFSTVSFRNYERTVGDHPAVSGGPALDLSWKYDATEPRSITDYELLRKRRRTGSEMIIKRAEREFILRSDLGVSRTELALHVRNITKIKNQRRQTLNNLRFSKVEETLQRIKRFIARCLCLRKKTDYQIQELWRKASDLSNSSSKGSHSNHSISLRNSPPSEVLESSQSSSKKSNIKKIKSSTAKKNRGLRSSKSMSEIDEAHHNRAKYDLTNSLSDEIDITVSNHRNFKYDLTDYGNDDSSSLLDSCPQQSLTEPATHTETLEADKLEDHELKNATVQDIFAEDILEHKTLVFDSNDIQRIEKYPPFSSSTLKRKPSITIVEDD